MGDGLKILCVYGKENVLHSKSIDVARYETGPADALYGSLVTDFTYRAFQFDVFHVFFKFKNVLLSSLCTNPIAPKSLLLFMGLQR